MSAEWPVNDDSVRESQACVSLPYHSISFSLEESLLPLSLSVCDDTRLACFSGFNLFMGDGISVAAVSSEMALTGRSHSDNNNPSIYCPPFSPFFSSLTSFPTQVSSSFSLTLFLFSFSCFLLPLSFIYPFTFDYSLLSL